MAPFALTLVRKSKRALIVAGLALDAGDNDSAVSRCYYAMFDIARAALLRAGVAEDKLPRTHNGVVEAFRNHAVQSGRIDRELGAELSRIESLRIKADYTGAEIELKEAREVVRKAELFVQTVERVFSLDELSLAAEYKNHNPGHDDKVSEPGGAVSKIEGEGAHSQPLSPEEMRREARENWLRLRQHRIEGTKGVNHGKDTASEARQDPTGSLDGDFDEQGDA